MKNYEFILVHPSAAEHVAVIQLNRPKELNALNRKMMLEVKDALQYFDADDSIRVMVITGNERAFAAGADITEMADASKADMEQRDQLATWDQIRKIRKPIVAAVSGFVLGGGCELMMHCDLVVASESARIGQPEIKIGVTPGAGGTQRLARSVGKALAMEMVLTGKFISAEQALNAGLINRVVPRELYLEEAISLAKQVAENSPVALKLAKESVLKAFNSTLDDGLLFERKNFYLCFESEDQHEGMQAFLEKRKPVFKGK